MHDLKYRELTTGTASFSSITPLIQSEALRPLIAVYEANINRTADLAVMPTMIAFTSRRDQLFLSNALFRVNGVGVTTLPELIGRPILTPEIIAAMDRQMKDFGKQPPEIQMQVTQILGSQFVDFHLENNAGAARGMEAILTSIVLESWSAFETFASDLWVTAVDSGPKALANKIALSERIKAGSEPISVRQLRGLEYDARHELGRFLRETRRVSFDSLASIVSAYSIAFDGPSREVETLFRNTNNNYIKALSAFRNVFVHRLGKANAEFTKQVIEFEEFRSIQKDEQIRLDGKIVSKLRNASVLMVMTLLKFVDDKLVESAKEQ